MEISDHWLGGQKNVLASENVLFREFKFLLVLLHEMYLETARSVLKHDVNSQQRPHRLMSRECSAAQYLGMHLVFPANILISRPSQLDSASYSVTPFVNASYREWESSCPIFASSERRILLD